MKIIKNQLFFNIIFLLSLCLFVFFAGIGSYGLLDKDEPRYAGTALEIIKNHNWIVPQFNYENRFDKPILFYWFIAASYKIFGISDFTSRLPSAICALLCVLFTWYVSKKVFGNKVALLSGIVLATSIEYVLLGRRAATDMSLCLLFSATMYSIFLSYFIKDFKIKILWCILAGVFSGLSILTKGPVGILLPFMILTVFLICRKQFDVKHLKVYFIILFFALIVALPWFVKVHISTNGEFTKVFFFEHNLKRFTSVVGEHPGPIWFYVPVVLGGFMPWTVFFMSSFFILIRRVLTPKFNKLLLYSFVWILTVFIFFSLSTTKLATYILLIFPPMAIVTSYWIYVLSKTKKRYVYIVFSSLVVIILPAMFYVFKLLKKWNIDDSIKASLLIKISLCILLLFFAIFSFRLFKRAYSFVLFFAVCFSVSFIGVLNSYLPLYYSHTHSDLRDFAKIAKENNASKIISFGMYRPSIAYYSGVPVNFDDKKQQKLYLKEQVNLMSNVYIIGHCSDIDKNKLLFDNVRIIDKRKKYFIGFVGEK